MSDEKVEEYTNALRSRNDVQVFIVDVKDIADYSRITIGATVNRVPALVVIRPRKLTGSVPTATVSYGFRDAASVNQAIDDAVYKGKRSRRPERLPCRPRAGSAPATLAAWIQRPSSSIWTTTRGAARPCRERPAVAPAAPPAAI